MRKVKGKDAAAVALGQKRWKGVPKAERLRLAHEAAAKAGEVHRQRAAERRAAREAEQEPEPVSA